MGRPPKEQGRKLHVFQIRMDDEEVKLLEKCAAAYGISKSEAIREGLHLLWDKSVKK